MSEVPLCTVCTRHLKGPDAESSVDEGRQCSLCFGILCPEFIEEVAAMVAERLRVEPYDSTSFVLAVNLPVSTALREELVECAYAEELSKGTLASVPFKLRVVDAYIGILNKATALRPTLNSDFTITLTFTNDEFNSADCSFILKHFGTSCLASGRKRRWRSKESAGGFLEDNYNKATVAAVAQKLTAEVARSYQMASPSKRCEFSASFEREPLFIASRYCKFSRSLPQSPWTANEDIPKIVGNSVSEKICSVLAKEAACESSRFIASGREDIDVRMLGDGRPFAVQLSNPRRMMPFRGEALRETLLRLEKEINAEKDVRLGSPLKRITVKQADLLKYAQDEKRKCYTAYCYSTQPLDSEVLRSAAERAPLKLSQKTPVRVLKRRPLLDRQREVFSMHMLQLDEYHFLIRMETQAGTYVKEFVHGDFGRTRPSLADLLGVQSGEVDILELDVEGVRFDWPPPDEDDTVA